MNSISLKALMVKRKGQWKKPWAAGRETGENIHLMHVTLCEALSGPDSAAWADCVLSFRLCPWVSVGPRG